MTNFTDFRTPLDCGCSLAEGRCDKHAAMMREIHDAWNAGADAVCDVIYSMQDGYGETGYVPEQGYDWSGIRDSSIESIESMWKAVHA